MTNTKPFPLDSVCNPNWDSMLKIFHSIDPTETGSKEKYIQLKEISKIKSMTERQHEGIIERCNNQINGTYGSTSREIQSIKK